MTKIAKNSEDFRRLFEAEVKKTYDPKTLDFLATEAVDIIQTRTRAGMDAAGKPFAGYSMKPLYISLRHFPAPKGGIKTPQTGRKQANFARRISRGVMSGAAASPLKRASTRGGKSMFFPGGYRQYKYQYQTHVTLDASGLMLNSIAIRRSGPTSRVLHFPLSLQNAKASGHDTGAGRLPVRRFFAIERQQDLDRLSKRWEALARGNV
jgi:hypothetical protein